MLLRGGPGRRLRRSAAPRRVVPVVAALACAVLVTCGATPAGAAILRPKGPTQAGFVVSRVIDGDTVLVTRDGVERTVRLIGINAPESVKPDSPVECFGPQASDFAKAVLTGPTVRLEYDDSQGRADQYGRTLAYLWVERPAGPPVLFNRWTVLRGFSTERQYGRTAPAWRSVLRAAQRHAQAHRVGLWGACR